MQLRFHSGRLFALRKKTLGTKNLLWINTLALIAAAAVTAKKVSITQALDGSVQLVERVHHPLDIGLEKNKIAFLTLGSNC